MKDWHNKRVCCMFCKSVAFVKPNRSGDPFLSCPKCTAINGKGPGFRDTLLNLPALPELSAPGSFVEKEKAPEPVEPEPEKQGDWFSEWAGS